MATTKCQPEPNQAETHQTDDKDKDLVFKVKRGDDFAYCSMCQAFRADGGFMHRNLPTTNWEVECQLPDETGTRHIPALCTDCLVEAQEKGVTVLDAETNEGWIPSGLRLRT